MKCFSKNSRMFRAYFFTVILAWSITTPQARAQNIGSFEFGAWEGPKINIYFAEPEGHLADAPIVIVMHGVSRNADEYRDNWIGIVREYGFAVYAPKFDKKQFPGAENYNLGAVNTDKPSAFAAIEPLFDFIRERIESNKNTYVIFGHSAGAQFVHRFVLLTEDTRISLAIAANAGWYTMPSVETDWPYGLGGLLSDEVDFEKAFSQRLIIMLGDEDNDPNARSLRKTREANAQGRHRLERGFSFLVSAKSTAEEMKIPLKWRYKIVKGVGHDDANMAAAAAPIITAYEN